MDKEDKFRKLHEEVEEDPDIIGFFLTGSRGKGRPIEHSDFDVKIIVKDGLGKECWEKYKEFDEDRHFDIDVKTLSEFEEHAKIGDPEEWGRYSYAHVSALIDRTGEIQEIIDQKGRIPEDEVEDYVSGSLDGYINYIYRSFKCFRGGRVTGARLEASKSIHSFLKVIFALEGRHEPYYKYLEWELKEYPLKKYDMDPDELIDALIEILETGNVEAQKKLFKKMEEVCREEGYGDVFDSWGKSIEWMKNFEYNQD